MTDAPEMNSDSASEMSSPKSPVYRWVQVFTILGILGIIACFVLPDIHRNGILGHLTQSKENLKQLGLALKNYSDSFQQLPTGTIPNAQLKPEERLSWIVSTLPFLNQSELYNSIHRELSWNHPKNAPYTKVTIPILLNPAQTNVVRPDGFGVTNYVGVAGVGKNAAIVLDKKVGAFAYDRTVRISSITDGLSNTMFVMDAAPEFGPWAQGGTATIRALTTKPYVNGPHWGYMQILLGDGSVRRINPEIEPSVLEALATIQGGDSLRD